MWLINTYMFVESTRNINKDLASFLKVEVQLVITHKFERMFECGRSI